ncbi:unnamed protein product [Schistosoma mattheei]|uniref:Uncharacterized protein n=1 Tax=Schistosoma mattheei TaxID=31246 RepID=A0A183Q1Q4_9TREM|nr:unnamed protein product [Schistosoma mattheei]
MIAFQKIPKLLKFNIRQQSQTFSLQQSRPKNDHSLSKYLPSILP